MIRWLAFVLCSSLAACGSTEPYDDPARNRPPQGTPEPQPPPEGSTAPEGETPTAAPAGARPLPRCGAPDPGIRLLTSYSGLGAGETEYRVSVTRDAGTGEWLPTPLPEMPHHHATRLEWTNAADFPELETADEQLRFTLRIQSRDVQRAAGNRWNALFHARIESVCSETSDRARPEGVRIASIGLDTSACAALEAAVAAAAADAAVCTRDAECVVRDIPLCDVRGVGCYWAAVNRDRPRAPLDQAIQRFTDQPCTLADCDCSGPPDRARCVERRCTAP